MRSSARCAVPALVLAFSLSGMLPGLSHAQAQAPARTLDPSEPGPAHRSERTAYRLSLWSTMAPIFLGVAFTPESGEGGASMMLASAGLLVGPAVGHFYGGDSGRALRGVGVRFGVAMASGLALSLLALDQMDGGGSDDFNRNAATLGAASFLALTYLVATDIGAARATARAHNERMLARHVAVRPHADPTGGYGLAFSARF